MTLARKIAKFLNFERVSISKTTLMMFFFIFALLPIRDSFAVRRRSSYSSAYAPSEYKSPKALYDAYRKQISSEKDMATRQPSNLNIANHQNIALKNTMEQYSSFSLEDYKNTQMELFTLLSRHPKELEQLHQLRLEAEKIVKNSKPVPGQGMSKEDKDRFAELRQEESDIINQVEAKDPAVERAAKHLRYMQNAIKKSRTASNQSA